MADQLVFYTIRSHGMILARLHMYDWIILLLLAVIDGLLNIIEPFHRFVGKDMMTDLRYPMKGNTVPFWAVPVCPGIFIFQYVLILLYPCKSSYVVLSCFSYFQLIGIILPWAIFVGIYLKKKNFYDLHHGILGIFHIYDPLNMLISTRETNLKHGNFCRDSILGTHNCSDY